MTYPVDHLPPNAPDAEQATLGACLISRSAVDAVAEIVTPEDFYHQAHRKVCEVVFFLAFERDEPADLQTVPEELRRRQWLDTCGGLAYIATLAESVPTAAHAQYYARTVAEKATLRKLLDAAEVTKAEVYEQALPVDEITARAEERFLAAGERPGQAEAVVAAVGVRETFGALLPGQERHPGYATGFSRLDWMLGGLQPGELFLVAGRSSMGKSEWCLHALRHMARQETPVLLLSLEQPGEQNWQRLIASEAGAPLDRLQRGELPDGWYGRTGAQACDRLARLPLYQCDETDLGTAQIRGLVRRYVSRHGIRVVCIDQLGIIKRPGKESEYVELSRTIREVKALARKLGVAVILQHQLSRHLERREDKRPLLSDLRDTGAAEETADRVLMLYRKGYYAEGGPQTSGTAETELLLRKNRITGVTGTSTVYFNLETRQFEETTHHYDGHEPPERGRMSGNGHYVEER